MDLASDRQPRERPAATALAVIFVAALAIRWAYAATLYGWMGDPALMSGDSYGYLRVAQRLVAELAAGELHGWARLGHDLSFMPLFPWLTALNVLLFGSHAALSTVLFQGVVDAGTCLLIYAMATLIAPRYALACGIIAALNPTQIVLSGLLLTDTSFLLFSTLSLFGAMLWMRERSWRAAAIIAIALAGGTLTRVFMLLWCPILVFFLFVAALAAKQLAMRVIFQLATIVAITLLSIAPILVRNVTTYGSWALTSQGGTHLLYWVVPLVNEAKTGTPWATGARKMAAELRQRYPQDDPNPFVDVRRHSEFGREKLMELGLPAMVKAWTIGAGINLAAPAIITVPPVAALSRTGFYDTKGASSTEKILTFLFRSDNALFAWIMITGIAGVVLMGLLQLAGLFALLWRPGTLLLLVLWTGFVLAINGPVASPKYRLPIEPVLMLLAGVGFCSVKARFGDARNKAAGAAS